jgi:hypothetical protein
VQLEREQGDQVVHLAGGNPLRERLEHGLGGLAGAVREQAGVVGDAVQQRLQRRSAEEPILRVRHQRSERLRQLGRHVGDFALGDLAIDRRLLLDRGDEPLALLAHRRVR